MTLLETFRMVTLAPGWVELPSAYGDAVLAKGAGHKYIKRVPKAGGGYRYFYHVAHGGGVHAEDHMVEGAAFKHEGGHYHIAKVDGDKLTIRHDETGESKTVSKAQLRGMLAEHHGKALEAHHAKAAKDLADAKKAGASAKQIAKLEKRVGIAGASADANKIVVSAPETAYMKNMVQKRNAAEQASKQVTEMMTSILRRLDDAGASDRVRSEASRYFQRLESRTRNNLPYEGFAELKSGRDKMFPALAGAPAEIRKIAGTGALDLHNQIINDQFASNDLRVGRELAAKDVKAREEMLASISPDLKYSAQSLSTRNPVSQFLLGEKHSLTPKELVESVHKDVSREADGGRDSANQAAWHEARAKLLGELHAKYGVGKAEGAFHAAEAGKHRASIKAVEDKAKAKDAALKKQAEEEKAAKKAKDDALNAQASQELTASVGQLKSPGKFNPNAKPMSAEKANARAQQFVSADPARGNLASSGVKDGRVIATDGSRLASVPTESNENAPHALHDKMVPMLNKKADHYATFDAESLARAVKGVLSAKKDRGEHTGKNRTFAAAISKDGLQDIASTPDAGSGSVKVPHDGSFGGRIGMNAKFLADALKGAKGTVRIGTSDEFSPVHIEREDGEHHIIMPIRL